MFNALRSDELLIGVGRVLRVAAAADGRLEGFERSLVMSATSVTGLLASEQRAWPALWESARAGLDAALASDSRPVASQARTRIAEAVDGPQLGEVLVALLADLPRPDPLRTAVQRVLRGLCDAEVAGLATPARKATA